MRPNRRAFLGALSIGVLGSPSLLRGAMGRTQQLPQAEELTRELAAQRASLQTVECYFDAEYRYLAADYAADPRRSFWANEGSASCITTPRAYRISLTTSNLLIIDIAARGRRVKWAEFLDGSRPPSVMHEETGPIDHVVRDFVSKKFMPRPGEHAPIYALGASPRLGSGVAVLAQDNSRYEVDLTKHCVVAREVFRGPADVRERTSFSSHEQVAPGAWFPMQVDFETIGERGRTLSVLTFAVHTLHVNQPLPTQAFRFRS